jgi:hypothetical protein
MLHLVLLRHYALRHERRKIQISEFLTFVLHGCEWSTSRPDHVISHKKPLVLNVWARENILLHLSWIEFLFLCCSARLRSQTHKLGVSEFYDPVVTGFQMFSSTPFPQAHPNCFISLISQPHKTNNKGANEDLNIIAYDALSIGKQLAPFRKTCLHFQELIRQKQTWILLSIIYTTRISFWHVTSIYWPYQPRRSCSVGER